MKSQKITIIDDDPQVAGLLTKFCELLHREAQVYSRVEQLDFTALVQSELILLDLNLGGNDGLDVLTIMQEQKIRTPIIICSGMDASIISSAHDILLEKNLVYSGTLSKPFSFQEFKSILSTPTAAAKSTQNGTSHAKIALAKVDIIQGLKKGWFYPVYQPQVDGKNHQITGIECLARLHHPLYGYCTPLDFIPLIEQFHLMERFTQNIVERAFDELSRIGLAEHVIISFNVSPTSMNNEFFEWMNSTVQKYQINTNRICLEITETRALTLSSEVKTVLTKFRIRGFNLSLDDFGTGYATILELNEMPFNEVKIDREFVVSMAQKNTSLAIVKSTVGLAQQLGYRCVAEGVETRQQADTLVQLGCQDLQGYLFSKPINIEQLKAFHTQT